MKVLWFVNVPFPALQRHLGVNIAGGGWWMPSLAVALGKDSSVRLGIATSWPSASGLVELEAGEIVHYAFPSGRTGRVPHTVGLRARIHRALGSLSGGTDRTILDHCQEVIKRFGPELIHVHGSEEPWGLVAGVCGVPTVLSMQGVLNGYLPLFWGTSAPLQRILMPREVKLWLEWSLRQAPRERRIFRRAHHFMGRTHWDRAWQEALQPRGRYWHVGELLRAEFYETAWELDRAERFTLFSTTSSIPLKGMDVLIRALALLCKRFPLAQLRIGGNLPNHGWGAYLRRLVRNLKLEKQVSFLGYLSSHEIAQHLARAHIYVLPSHVENSPNSLCEAQLVGLPCVASCAGGVPSLVEHGQTGLLFPRGNHAALAGMASALFDNDEWTRQIGARARETAQHHHAPEVVVRDLLNAYDEVIKGHNLETGLTGSGKP